MNLNFCLPKFWVIALFLTNSWFLSGAYLKTYTSYGYEIMWVNRSHQGGVQCTWTLTLGCFIFELLPSVYFHTWILSGAYLQDYTRYGYEISWMVITWGKTGIFCDNLPLLFQIWNCCLQTLTVWKSLKFVIWERLKWKPMMCFITGISKSNAVCVHKYRKAVVNDAYCFPQPKPSHHYKNCNQSPCPSRWVTWF